MEARTTFEVTIEDSGEAYRCGSDESLLHGMAKMGKRGIPLGCRGGGCGVCRVQVVSGQVRAKVMSRDHVTEAEEKEGCLLACRAYPQTDVALRVLGNLKKNVCRSSGG